LPKQFPSLQINPLYVVGFKRTVFLDFGLRGGKSGTLLECFGANDCQGGEGAEGCRPSKREPKAKQDFGKREPETEQEFVCGKIPQGRS